MVVSLVIPVILSSTACIVCNLMVQGTITPKQAHNPGTMIIDFHQLEPNLLCRTSILDLSVCVGRGGQAFTWCELGTSAWCNMVMDHLVILYADDENVYFKTASEDVETVRDILRDYFRLDEDAEALLNMWASKAKTLARYKMSTGARVLRIDPWECLLSFICSQNNAIYRILKMVQTLKREFGTLVCTVRYGDESVEVFSFPQIEQFLGSDTEARLRSLGFGYRSKYFKAAAEYIQSVDELYKLRGQPYDSVTDYLLKIPGVGPKVADCVALYSLDQLEAVPIDTHMLKIAKEHVKVSTKSLTLKTYRTLSKHLQELFGQKAGWAQVFLFVGSLKR